jgi:hypothetical protein
MPWEKTTVPDRTTLAGNGPDMVADSPESSTLSEVALFRGLPVEQLPKSRHACAVGPSPSALTSSPLRSQARPYRLFWRTA